MPRYLHKEVEKNNKM